MTRCITGTPAIRAHQSRTARQVLSNHPERVVVPSTTITRNRLGRQQMTNLRVYAGAGTRTGASPAVLDGSP